MKMQAQYNVSVSMNIILLHNLANILSKYFMYILKLNGFMSKLIFEFTLLLLMAYEVTLTYEDALT